LPPDAGKGRGNGQAPDLIRPSWTSVTPASKHHPPFFRVFKLHPYTPFTVGRGSPMYSAAYISKVYV